MHYINTFFDFFIQRYNCNFIQTGLNKCPWLLNQRKLNTQESLSKELIQALLSTVESITWQNTYKIVIKDKPKRTDKGKR